MPVRPNPSRSANQAAQRRRSLLLLGTLLLAVPACSSTSTGTTAAPAASNLATPPSGNIPPGSGVPAGKKVTVAAAFYPIAEAAQRVGATLVEVENLTPAGSGPHDLELTAKQVTTLESATVLLYLSKGFQPSVEKAAAQLPSSVAKVDVLAGLDLLNVGNQLEGTQGEVDGEVLEGGEDPHVWVDPELQSKIASTVGAALVQADPGNKATYEKNLATYQAELATLSGKFRAGLKTCRSRVVVTSHRAFGYLANRYDLTQISIAGISPEEEPDPQTLQAVAQAAKDNNVEVIFFEESLPSDLADTVANEIVATTDVLDPVETISEDELGKGATYASVQTKNLAALSKGLGCNS